VNEEERERVERFWWKSWEKEERGREGGKEGVSLMMKETTKS
jgi:hypothetical protein